LKNVGQEIRPVRVNPEILAADGGALEQQHNVEIEP
jgi:hypothetical protein